MKRFINYAYCFSFALAMSVPMVASAQVPQTMSYQAALTDNTGNAVADGVYDLAFSLYDSAVDGTTLWTEAQQVEIQNGLLHVLLGSVNPLALAFDKPYWLGISVGGEAEMEPRIALSSAPYALAAAQKILEPEAGDGFVIKNSEGQVAHHLASDGTAIHAGEVSAQAFHVVVDGDTLISFNADGTSYHSGLEEYAGGILVREELLVTGENGEVVIGESNPDNPTGEIGVRVNNSDGELVGGLNRRDLDTGETIGVAGRALNEGDLAGYFYGDVEIEGGGLYILSPDGDTLTAFYPDGTSFHSGLEEYAGGIKISGNGNGIEFADGSSITTAPTGSGGGFNGVLEGTDLVIKDAQGNETIRLNSDGTSFHGGLEEFAGGILVDDEITVHGDNGELVIGEANPDNPTGEIGVRVNNSDGELVGGFNRRDLDTGETIGVVGRANEEGDLAGLFQGDVEIEDGGLYILSPAGDTLTAFFPDGTSYHSGLEEYAGGIQISGNGNGLQFADGTSMTTAPSGGSEFDGTLVGKDLIVLGQNGETAFRVNTDGTSSHYGLETFFAGIEVDNSELVVTNANGDPAVTIGTDEEGSGRIHSTGSIRLGNSIVIDGIAHTIDSDDPLEILVAGLRALRLEPDNTSPNVIGGHRDNTVTAGAFGGTIGGGGATGSSNSATDNYGTVAGGFLNRAGDNTGATDSAPFATVGGGELNIASGESATVAGGNNNTAGGNGATIGGGGTNQANGTDATIAGGGNNDAPGFEAAIGGGSNNTASAEASTVAGGQGNSATGNRAAIGGGQDNTAQGPWSAIAGGQDNTATTQAFVGGGLGNNASGLRSSVVGGEANAASGPGSIISGGKGNEAGRLYSTVAGGEINVAGDDLAGTETHQSVGGGYFNLAHGAYSMIPGGMNNFAGGAFSFAAGRNAKGYVIHDGVFVWADSHGASFFSAAPNEFAARAQGGVRFVTAVDVSGTPTAGVQLAAGGSSWSVLSDRNAKTDFSPVDSDEILDALHRMPITSWRYKTQGDAVRHVGPMAQDFHEAFGLGEDEKRINTLDLDGISLAAAKGLYERVLSLEETVLTLESRLAEIEAKLADQ